MLTISIGAWILSVLGNGEQGQPLVTAESVCSRSPRVGHAPGGVPMMSAEEEAHGGGECLPLGQLLGSSRRQRGHGVVEDCGGLSHQ